MSEKGEKQTQMVDLRTLSPEQLNQFRQAVANELEYINQSYGSLKHAYSRFSHALEALKELKPENKGADVFVPLTGSLYVPGQLADVERVMVEIGGGYLVSKTRVEAEEYLQRKMGMVGGHIEAIGVQIQRKRAELETVTGLLQDSVLRAQSSEQDFKAKQQAVIS